MDGTGGHGPGSGFLPDNGQDNTLNWIPEAQHNEAPEYVLFDSHKEQPILGNSHSDAVMGFADQNNRLLDAVDYSVAGLAPMTFSQNQEYAAQYDNTFADASFVHGNGLNIGPMAHQQNRWQAVDNDPRFVRKDENGIVYAQVPLFRLTDEQCNLMIPFEPSHLNPGPPQPAPAVQHPIAEWRKQKTHRYSGFTNNMDDFLEIEKQYLAWGSPKDLVDVPADLPSTDGEWQRHMKCLVDGFTEPVPLVGGERVPTEVPNISDLAIEMICGRQLVHMINAAKGQCEIPKHCARWSRGERDRGTFTESVDKLANVLETNKIYCNNLTETTWGKRYAWNLKNELVTKGRNHAGNARRQDKNAEMRIKSGIPFMGRSRRGTFVPLDEELGSQDGAAKQQPGAATPAPQIRPAQRETDESNSNSQQRRNNEVQTRVQNATPAANAGISNDQSAGSMASSGPITGGSLPQGQFRLSSIEVASPTATRQVSGMELERQRLNRMTELRRQGEALNARPQQQPRQPSQYPGMMDDLTGSPDFRAHLHKVQSRRQHAVSSSSAPMRVRIKQTLPPSRSGSGFSQPAAAFQTQGQSSRLASMELAPVRPQDASPTGLTFPAQNSEDTKMNDDGDGLRNEDADADGDDEDDGKLGDAHHYM